MQSIENKILTKIRKCKKGTLFINADFIVFGTSKAVSKAIERLVKKGDISRY